MNRTVLTTRLEIKFGELDEDAFYFVYSIPVKTQYAVIVFRVIDDVAMVDVAIGDTEEHACHLVYNPHVSSDIDNYFPITGKVGISGLLAIINGIASVEDWFREFGAKEICVCACDDKRARAYRRLTKYGYEEEGTYVFTKAIAV